MLISIERSGNSTLSGIKRARNLESNNCNYGENRELYTS